MQQVSFLLLFSAMVSHSAAKAGLEFTMLSKLALNIWSRKKERTNSPNVSPDLNTPTVMHTLTIDIHILFFNGKVNNKTRKCVALKSRILNNTPRQHGALFPLSDLDAVLLFEYANKKTVCINFAP